MTKEDKKWLKANEPWNYDALYGDPVTGFSGSDNGGCFEFILICLIALAIVELIILIQ